MSLEVYHKIERAVGEFWENLSSGDYFSDEELANIIHSVPDVILSDDCEYELVGWIIEALIYNKHIGDM